MVVQSNTVDERTETGEELSWWTTGKCERKVTERFAPAAAIELLCSCDGQHAGRSSRAHRVPCGALAVTSERIDSVVAWDLCAHCTAGREIILRLEPLPAIALEPCAPSYDARRGMISYGDARITNLRLGVWLHVDAEEFSYVHLCQLPDIYRVHEAASVPPHESRGTYKFAAVHDDGSIALYDDEDGELTSHGGCDDPHVVAVARALRARGTGMRDRSLSR